MTVTSFKGSPVIRRFVTFLSKDFDGSTFNAGMNNAAGEDWIWRPPSDQMVVLDALQFTIRDTGTFTMQTYAAAAGRTNGWLLQHEREADSQLIAPLGGVVEGRVKNNYHVTRIFDRVTFHDFGPTEQNVMVGTLQFLSGLSVLPGEQIRWFLEDNDTDVIDQRIRISGAVVGGLSS